MSDVTVTLTNMPVNVTVSDIPISVIVATPGPQGYGTSGERGPEGLPGTGVVNLGGLISTGDADNRYYFKTNPEHYMKSGEATNVNLSGYSTSGNVEATGTAVINLLGLYYLKTNPNNFSTSGNLEFTGTSLQNQILVIKNGTGTFLQSGASGYFYPWNNPNNFAKSGDLQSTGSALQNQIFSIIAGTGVFIQGNNLVGLIKSGDVDVKLQGLISTGQSDLRYLQTGASGFWYPISNPNQFIKSGDVDNKLNGLISTGSADLRYINTGASGNFYPRSNPNNFVQSGQFISGVSITGGIAIQGAFNLSAGANIVLTQQGTNTLSISSTAAGGGNTNITGLISTGDADLRYLNTGASGQFYLKSNPNNFIKSGEVNSISGSLQQNIERSGGYLYGLINASSAGVSSVNSASGALTIAGAGNIAIGTAGQTITITGQTGFVAALFDWPSSGKIISVDSMKALRALNVTGIDNNSKIHLKSYYNDDEPFVINFGQMSRDEGGGVFYWNSSCTFQDDSGRYIRPNSYGPNSTGRWERLLEGGIPNVHMWGAKGDAYKFTDPTSGEYLLGSDDTKAIQNALNTVIFGYGGTLRFPARVYKVTDTLYWNTQTQLIGDGTLNASTILMKENINKDIIRTTAWSGALAWNANPTNPSINAATYGADIPRMKDMYIGYAGNTYLHDPFYYSGVNASNTGNSILTFAAVGETNLIQGCYFLGGKYAIRIMAGSPGLRAYGCTIAGMGEASISVESFPTQISGATGWSPVFDGGGGMLSLIDCSCDYNGNNTGVGGFAFVKVHNQSYPNIYIKNLKLEGDYPGGVVTYIKTSGQNGKFSHIDINGLNWNGTTQSHIVPQSVVIISGENSAVTTTVPTSLQNLFIQDVTNLVKDYILTDNENNPYILKTENWLGTPNYTHAVPPVHHYGQRLTYGPYRGQPSLNYSSIEDIQSNSTQIKFRPLNTGWYRVAIGGGNTRVLFDHEFSICCQNNYYELKALVDYNETDRGCRLESQTANYQTFNSPITRARLFIDPNWASGENSDRAYLDIFFKTLPNTGVGFEGYETLKYVTVDSKVNQLHGFNPLITPIYLSGLDINSITDSSSLYPYSEVDLTRQKDVSQSRPNVPKDAFLIDKDYYLFTTANRDLRYFDAGAYVTMNGGGGTNAAGIPIIVNGAIEQVLITNSGDGGYSSAPIINVYPNTPGNGTGAFISGFVLNGYLFQTKVISGGVGYGVGPNSSTDGYSLTGATSSNAGSVGGVTGIYTLNTISISGAVGIIGGTGVVTSLSGNRVVISLAETSLTTLTGAGTVTLFNSGSYLFISGQATNLGGLISTGSADLRYINTGASGGFYPRTNPNNFIKSGDFSLNGFITTGVADARYIQTGASGGFYLATNPNNFISSGNVDTKLQGLITTGAADLRYLFSGSSGAFYASSNPNNFISSGNVDTKLQGLITTGVADLRYLVTGASGQFYLASNPNQFIKSGDVDIKLQGLITTGAGDLRYLNTGASGQFYKVNNPNNFSSSGNVEATGTALQNQLAGYYLKNNPNNFVQSGQFVSGVSITGGIAIQGALNLNAGANISLTQAGLNTVTIAATAGGGASYEGVTGLTVSGGVAISGAIQFIGIYGTNVVQSGNTIGISGGGGGGSNITNNYTINSGSGIFIYRSGIASGVGNQFIAFPTILDSRPIVLATLHNDYFDDVLGFQVSGANPTGFWAIFSDTTSNTGYYLDIQASSANPSGMTPTVIVNNTTVVGSTSTTSFIDFPVQSIKLPVASGANRARIDAGNINWEVLFASSGSSSQSGFWQFMCPTDFNSAVTPKLHLNMSMKNVQTGVCILSMRASIYSVSPFGQTSINTPTFGIPNTGNLTLATNLSPNFPLQMIIPLVFNSGMNTGNFTMLQLDRNITTFAAGTSGASGDCALLAMALEYGKV